MRVTMLGCGGSGGVPLANGSKGGHWGACDPSNPKNRRRRVSLLLEEGDRAALIDASPDLREQLMDHEIAHLDALLLTHAHADHCHGLDEFRAIANRRGAPIPTYMDAKTRAQLTLRFDYVFTSSHTAQKLYPALLEDRTIDGPFDVLGQQAIAFEQNHGNTTSLGFRIGNFAYSTDVKALDERAFGLLQGLDLWIVDALRFEPHPTHSHFEQTLSWITRVKPKLAVLTHMNHSVDYDTLKARCPAGVVPGYDGLSVDLAAF